MLLGVIFLPALSFAQSLQLTTLTEEDGLSSNAQWSTNAICEDSFGFVWFATLGGLDRYDGYELKSYRGIQNNNRDISNNRITAIAEYGKGNLMLGTEEEGLIYFDRKKEIFSPQQDIAVNGDTVTLKQINAIRKRGKDELIVATAFQGIFLYHITSGEFSEIVVDHPSFSVKSTNNLVVLKDQRLAIVSFNGVFVESKGGIFDFFPIDKNNYLKFLIELPDGNLLVRAHNRSEEFLLEVESGNAISIKSKVETPNCSGIVDKNGNLWLNNSSGKLYKKNGGLIGTYLAQVERKGTYFPICMQDMHVSDNGNIYYTSYAGAGSFKYSEPLIKPHLDEEITIFHLFDGVFYYAVGNTLFRNIEGKKEKVLSLPNEYRDNKIYNFYKDRSGNYWVGHLADVGMGTEFDRNGKQLNKSYFSALSPQYIELQEDGLFTIGNEVFREEEKTKKYKFIGRLYEEFSGAKFPDYRVKYYKQLRNGEIWLATFSNGINILDRVKKEVRELPINPQGNGALKSNNPYYIFEHSSGKVFLATEQGIHIWDPQLETFDYLDERPENKSFRIMSMGEDANGRLWILTAKHLQSFDLKSKELREFTLSDAVFVDYNEPRDMHLLPEGKMVFQGFNRIYSFVPGLFTSQTPPKAVTFTDLFVDRKKVYPGGEDEILNSSLLFIDELDLTYNERNLGFSFVSMGGQGKSLSYFYRLLGENENWIETQKEREIHYSNLSPGDYVFEVKARGGSGLWTPVASQIRFSISPPWYLTKFAFIAYALAAFAMLYLIYRIRVNQLIKYQNLRIKVSSDLHDDVGSLLTGISMKAQILSLNKNEKEKEDLSLLSQLSHKAMDQMRDIVWALDARKDTVEDLKQRMLTYAQENLSLKNIKYHIDFKTFKGLQGINPEQRQNLYFIFKEAITNILKHSNASHVAISFQKTPMESKLEIHDNGTVKESLKEDGQGLANIKMRAERLGGQAHIDTSQGFKITIKF